MKRTKIKQLPTQIGNLVMIKGWVNNIRDQGAIMFLIIRDDTDLVQVVVDNTNTNLLELTKTITTESVVEITGILKKVKQAPKGYEILAKNIDVLSLAKTPLPIAVAEKSENKPEQPIRLDWRFLDLRKPRNQLIMNIWTTMEYALMDFLIKQEFTEIHSPKLMSTPSESGAELFEVKYFDRKAYLSQSPQFYKQMAISSGFEKVFEIGPVFRAEPSFTTRHATEFIGFDVEMAYISSFEEVIDFEENLLIHIFKQIKEKHEKDIKNLFFTDIEIPKKPFPQISLLDAKKVLSDKGIKSKAPDDISPEEEREIAKYIKNKYNHDFVAITKYPTSTRPFYHMKLDKKSNLTSSFDMIYRGTEITTGAQREHRYDILISQAKEKGIDLSSLEYYLNFFKYGCPPHGGFGLGPARIIMKMLKQPNIREVTFLHRGVNRLKP